MLSWSQELERSAYAMDGQRWAGLRAQRVASVDSTNSALLRSAQAGDTAPQVLWADVQTAGRGRMGRQWASQSQQPQQDQERRSLCFSIGLVCAPRDWSGLSLVVGLAAAQVLGEAVALKWPNDLCVRQGSSYAKLGGILLETQALPAQQGQAQGVNAGRWLVIGLGLNLQGLPTGDLRAPAADLALALGQARAAELLADVEGLCTRLVLAILQAVQRFEATGFAPFAPAFVARDVLLGQGVYTVHETGTGEAGTALGVAADGSYQLRLVSGLLHSIHSAEISLRPLVPAAPAVKDRD